MPEYLSPGVYIQEVDSGPRPIEGVGTATAAFVGLRRQRAGQPAHPGHQLDAVRRDLRRHRGRGAAQPLHGRGLPAPRRIRLLPQRRRALLHHPGHPALVQRRRAGRVPEQRAAPQPGLAGGALADGRVQGRPDGGHRDRGRRRRRPRRPRRRSRGRGRRRGRAAATPDGSLFNLRVRMADQSEEYPNVTLGKQRNVRNVVETVNQASTLVTLAEGQATGPLADRAPEAGTYVLRSEAAALVPAVEPKDFVGEITERSGMEGLEIADDVTMVCCPDVMAAYQAGSHRPGRGQGGAAGDDQPLRADGRPGGHHRPPAGPVAPGSAPVAPGGDELRLQVRRRSTTPGSRSPARTGGRWRCRPPATWPASTPAATTSGGCTRPPPTRCCGAPWRRRSPITKGEQDVLNPIGVNCLRSFPGRGLRVWGARTLSSDPAWRYINVRRLFNYVEKSIQDGLQWVVFEPNDSDLWARVRRDMNAFLTGVWREGVLFGAHHRPGVLRQVRRGAQPARRARPGAAVHRHRPGAGQAGRVRHLPPQPVGRRRRLAAEPRASRAEARASRRTPRSDP